MKKYHYIIISITFAIYGFVFYQRHYAGPDVVDYFREKERLHFAFIDDPDLYIGKIYKMYSDYKPKGIPNTLDNSILIYFNKDKSDLKLNCQSVTDYGEITGVINSGIEDGEEYYYFKNIQSIYAYDTKKSANEGMKILCYGI